jgi:hypothetical protein
MRRRPEKHGQGTYCGQDERVKRGVLGQVRVPGSLHGWGMGFACNRKRVLHGTNEYYEPLTIMGYSVVATR